MAAPWPLGAIAVATSLLESLWLSPGGPVWESFVIHFGGGFGSHVGADLERLKCPGQQREGVRQKAKSKYPPG